MKNNKSKKFLDYLQEAVQSSFKVQSFIDFPKPWIEYNSEGFESYVEAYGFPNHREILRYEIFLDIDSDNSEAGRLHANLVEKRLKEENYFYSRWKSGGDGEHFHLVFNKFFMDDLYKEYSIPMVKKELVKIIVGEEIIKPKDIASHICLYDKKLVQIEWMPHRKGGVKSLVSRKRGINNIPTKLISALKNLRERQKITEERIQYMIDNNENVELQCIPFLEGKTVNRKNLFKINDGYYRAMFALIAQYTRDGLPKDKIKEKIDLWKKQIPGKWWRTHRGIITEYKINYAIRTATGGAGCYFCQNLLEDIGALKVCKGCPFYVTDK